MEEKLEQLRIQHEQELRMCEKKAQAENIRAEARLTESELLLRKLKLKPYK